MYYLGLMSGTSVDGIDAAIVDFDQRDQVVIAASSTDYSASLKARIHTACKQTQLTRDQVIDLDFEIGEAFADAALELLSQSGVDPSVIHAIGSHGQTVHHAPNADPPYSLQIGDGSIIGNRTGITTVYDFRTADILAGGQGAPLAPAFHGWLAGETGKACVILNIGGIANISLLDTGGHILGGSDTGPGNTLMDRWIETHRQQPFDRDGTWAQDAAADEDLIALMLDDAYFKMAPPKSTGREYFNLPWLHDTLEQFNRSLEPAVVQASLLQLTVRSITQAIHSQHHDTERVYVCGGGAHNKAVMRQLQVHMGDIPVDTTMALGLDPNWVEAAAFAWLARETLAGRPGNIPSVTGAKQAVILGQVHQPDPV
ncbi:MAG: anhydro-N-acetylmuramic acid kinase [Gammaproteobacteria bacterium]|nr:anhydro-N-acetylmuramic acid kinase [Gammaproteobacteria bacterium]